ncbi:energy transducer TonB [Aurantiacibacter sediminis]|uniref:Energy transducer TonB n=1 Tax=Aurantiacibacter sediminis TaxID=2793064 RepID=A0ABS0N5I0_9SPHN|nr:energy transducer TonB [Aurantiacibacter sediminis]MBH5323062.1 energy transducer TonB [Aurantiacibacter sediminis]
MSYANATISPAERIKAAGTVVGVHALLGAGLVAGLAVTTYIVDPPIEDNPTVFHIPDVPPPPPEPVPTDAVVPVTPPAAPVPPLDIPTNNPVQVAEPDFTLPPITTRVPVDPPIRGPIAVEPPPPPAPSYTPAPPVPRNNMGSWITTNDYSGRDLRRGNEGTARYRLVIGSDGRVDACDITSSTGHSSLDRSTCRLITQRARFNPATNNQGEQVVGTYTGTVTWQIPE